MKNINETAAASTAAALGIAEAELRTAADMLAKLESDTQTPAHELAPKLSNARETVRLLDERATQARADYRRELAQAVEERAQEVEAEAAALDVEAAAVVSEVRGYLLKHFSEQATETLLTRERPAQAAELARRATNIRGHVESARNTAKNSLELALQELFNINA